MALKSNDKTPLSNILSFNTLRFYMLNIIALKCSELSHCNGKAGGSNFKIIESFQSDDDDGHVFASGPAVMSKRWQSDCAFICHRLFFHLGA